MRDVWALLYLVAEEESARFRRRRRRVLKLGLFLIFIGAAILCLLLSR